MLGGSTQRPLGGVDPPSARPVGGVVGATGRIERNGSPNHQSDGGARWRGQDDCSRYRNVAPPTQLDDGPHLCASGVRSVLEASRTVRKSGCRRVTERQVIVPNVFVRPRDPEAAALGISTLRRYAAGTPPTTRFDREMAAGLSRLNIPRNVTQRIVTRFDGLPQGVKTQVLTRGMLEFYSRSRLDEYIGTRLVYTGLFTPPRDKDFLNIPEDPQGGVRLRPVIAAGALCVSMALGRAEDAHSVSAANGWCWKGVLRQPHWRRWEYRHVQAAIQDHREGHQRRRRGGRAQPAPRDLTSNR